MHFFDLEDERSLTRHYLHGLLIYPVVLDAVKTSPDDDTFVSKSNTLSSKRSEKVQYEVGVERLDYQS